MTYKNEKEDNLLREWGLKAMKLPVKTFVPFGFAKKWHEKGIPVTKEFAVKVNEIEADDWILTFGLNFTDSIAIVISRNITELREKFEEKAIKDFDIDDIIKKIKSDRDSGKEERDAHG